MASKIDEVEAIGKALQERKAEMPEPSTLDLETWDNEGFPEKVRQILLSGRMMDIDVSKIRLPEQGLAKYQFRRTREEIMPTIDGAEEADELKESIKTNGVLEPIIVQEVGDHYYIIDGHSRFFLWRELLAENPELLKPTFLVLDCPDTVAMQLAAELNRNGQNLSSEDASVLVIRLFEEGKMKQVDIAAMMNFSKGYVSEVISAFRDVPDEARALVESGEWTIKHGRELARLKDNAVEQSRIMKQAITTHYDASTMESKVDSILARIKWQREAEKQLKAANIEGHIEGEEVRVLRARDVDKIHREVVKETTEPKRSYMGAEHGVVTVGKGEYEPTVAATTKILKKMGYEVLPGEAPAEKASAEPEKPKMPTNDELMQESYYKSICPICKGRTHPVVAEELGFKTTTDYGVTGHPGLAHQYCMLRSMIEKHEKEIKKFKDKLATDDLSLMITAGESLEAINGKSHDIYKQELEARKEAWRKKNLPEKAAKKASKATEPKPEVRGDLDTVLAQIRQREPKLVPSTHDYWGAYLRYKHQEDGWDSLPKVGAQLGISHQSVANQFQKLDKAVAAQGASQ